ncbi:hypothetical protein EXIGUO8H_440002 [Exiguobacterium sp. 8H]|uniref:hypothetical protein n=1 Tax=unclassified Exiguobacterium TaxID=2644629 RepID=UPI0012F333DC|nr:MULTISPECIES: hypothetical protein [unclassified Exiguobacterium]VXC04174.1 hypothetical protein EXIGUO8H_440002 [Exiguobacterium sp. 8H]VXC04904.1 hypothetical protein EXIGUO8A_740002 [Exiguobacterium sp. 8A]
MKRMRWNVLLIGVLLLLGGLLLTLSGCGRAEALDTLYEGEGPTIITYDEANEMLEAGKTFFFYEGGRFDIKGESEISKMVDRVFKENDVHYFIINERQYPHDDRIYALFHFPHSEIGLVHEGEIHQGEQNIIAEGGKTREDIERDVDKDVRELLTLVDQ